MLNLSLSGHVKLFGRRPHLGRATRTGPASEKLQGTKPRWGNVNFRNTRQPNYAASGINRKLIFGAIDAERRCNLDVLARMLR